MDGIKHCSIENPATQYDEESLTVLELCGRLAAKFNELVNAYNINENAIRKAIAAWLSANPDAMATVNNYFTPQAFGAVADGVTDDTAAVQMALAMDADVYFPAGTYLVTDALELKNGRRIYGDGVNSVIKSGAPVILTTSASGCIVERLTIEGSGSNTALSVFKDNNTVRDVVIKKCGCGITNKNSDYMGSVRMDGVLFDYVTTCFRCTTLCNGVSFRGCVAYHYDTFVEAYWLEGVSFDSCFIEKGNYDAAVLRLLSGKSNMQALGVTFNGCYIEGKDNFTFAECAALMGVLTFTGCWLKTSAARPLFDMAALTNATRFNITGCTINAKSTSAIVAQFGANQKVLCINNTGLVDGVGGFNLTAGNITGDGVVFVDGGSGGSGGAGVTMLRFSGLDPYSFSGVDETRFSVFVSDTDPDYGEYITGYVPIAWEIWDEDNESYVTGEYYWEDTNIWNFIIRQPNGDAPSESSTYGMRVWCVPR